MKTHRICGMETRPKSKANFLVIALSSAILFVALVSGYVAGYFALCEPIMIIRLMDGTGVDGQKFSRPYRSELLTNIYKPMAYVESVITQTEVETVHRIIVGID